MIIARSVTPLPFINLSIPFYLFLPSNLRGVVSYLNLPRAKDVKEEDFYDYLRKNINRANGFICNSLKEFDEKYLDEFYQLTGKQLPVYFVGPIISDGQKSTESKVSLVNGIENLKYKKFHFRQKKSLIGLILNLSVRLFTLLLVR